MYVASHPPCCPPSHFILCSGHWLLKLGLWALCNVLPFFLPPGVVGAYSWLARFGSPFFLLIQMVILLVRVAAWAAAAGALCCLGCGGGGNCCHLTCCC